nr:hypothetical protein [Kocuria atrinae]
MPFDPKEPATGPMPTYEDRGDEGYKKSLGNFQIQMIAIGGAIGVGLFLGIGQRLATAGPAWCCPTWSSPWSSTCSCEHWAKW